VIGGSQVSGANHTFLWTSATGMKDLGLLGTDLGNLPGSGMGGINNNGQVVGLSCMNDPLCDSTNPSFMARAYLWQNGKMMDLNSLVVGGEPLYLIFACHINDAGEIVGFGATSTGEIHAFSATPIHTVGPSPHSAEREVTGPITLPDEARRLLQQRMPFGRVAPKLMEPPR